MASLAGFTALYFWMHRLRVRAQSLLDARLEAHEERGA
jgi:hypothetical protein